MNCDGAPRGPAASIKENAENGFVRRIDFEPGYDHWTTPCSGRHGRHGMQIRFLLMAEGGVTQFLMYTDWTPGSVDGIGSMRGSGSGTMAADLGHHWLSPVYEGESLTHEACEYLHGAPCFYDGSGLNAGPVLTRFVDHGLDAVWAELETYHRECSEWAAELRGART